MTLKEPESMDGLIYFTRRSHDKGMIMAWTRKDACPKCKNALMGKPRDEKTGKVKIRAKEYLCPACGHTEEKQAYEKTLTVEIRYDCPHCGAAGEHSMPFKRKKVQIIDEKAQKKMTVDVLRFPCAACGKNIDITKKMK